MCHSHARILGLRLEEHRPLYRRSSARAPLLRAMEARSAVLSEVRTYREAHQTSTERSPHLPLRLRVALRRTEKALQRAEAAAAVLPAGAEPLFTVFHRDGSVALGPAPVGRVWEWLTIRMHQRWEARWEDMEPESRIRRMRQWAALVPCRLISHSDRGREFVDAYRHEFRGLEPGFGGRLHPEAIQSLLGHPGVCRDGTFTTEEVRRIMEASMVWVRYPLPATHYLVQRAPRLDFMAGPTPGLRRFAPLDNTPET